MISCINTGLQTCQFTRISEKPSFYQTKAFACKFACGGKSSRSCSDAVNRLLLKTHRWVGLPGFGFPLLPLLDEEDIVFFMVMHRLPSVVWIPILSHCCCHLTPNLLPNPGVLEWPDARSEVGVADPVPQLKSCLFLLHPHLHSTALPDSGATT